MALNGKGDDRKLNLDYQRESYDVPEEEHQEEINRHPVAWAVMTFKQDLSIFKMLVQKDCAAARKEGKKSVVLFGDVRVILN